MFHSVRIPAAALLLAGGFALLLSVPNADAQQKEKKAKAVVKELPFPPELPGGKASVTISSPELLKSTTKLLDGVTIAKAAPTIEFALFPGQTYKGNPWSVWGDSTLAGNKYYAAFGDHQAPQGNAFVYEYDLEKKSFRLLTDVKKLLDMPEGHYVPGKIHSRVDLGDDGWLYFATHRGSTRVTTDQYHFKGDWIVRCHPETGKSEIVVHGPVPKHCIPTGILDPKRMIFYGSTAPGTGGDGEGIHFFAYDVKNRKLLYSGPDGPARCIVVANSTGKVYYNAGKGGGDFMRFDPTSGKPPEKIDGTLPMRAASLETPGGMVYAISQGGKDGLSELYAFDTQTEKIELLGPAQVGTAPYITSIKVDPSGRYLYYIPGAHGSADRDGSPVVQFDVKTKTRKIIAFLHPHFKEQLGIAPVGTYSMALTEKGDKLCVTWNATRGGKTWDCVALSVIHIPESERTP